MRAIINIYAMSSAPLPVIVVPILVNTTLKLADVFNVSITNADATSMVMEKVKQYPATKGRLRYILRCLPLPSAPHYNSTVHMIEKVGWAAIAEEFDANR